MCIRDRDAAEDVGFMPHTVCRRQEGAPGVQALPEDRALNSFAAGETAETENTAAPQMEAETPDVYKRQLCGKAHCQRL